MDEYVSQLSWGGRWSFQFFLRDGDGLEAVQLLEQAAALGGVQAVDEVARALRRVERLHGLLLGVRAQRPRQQRPPAARLPGPGPPAARAPAPEEGQQPRHGGVGGRRTTPGVSPTPPRGPPGRPPRGRAA